MHEVLKASTLVCRPPTSAELLRAIALARGWVVGNGLPDEARAGRLLLKDYTSGKLVYCEQPPNTHGDVQAEAPHGGHDHHDYQPDSSYDTSEGRKSTCNGPVDGYTSGKLTYCKRFKSSHGDVHVKAPLEGHQRYDSLPGNSYNPS